MYIFLYKESNSIHCMHDNSNTLYVLAISGVNGSLFYKRLGYEFETAKAIWLSAMNGYTI